MCIAFAKYKDTCGIPSYLQEKNNCFPKREKETKMCLEI